MIMIPKSVVFFILGFVSAIVLLIILVIVSIKHENNKNQMVLDKFLESLSNKDDEK